MKESINVVVDDHETTQVQGNLSVVLSDHENETSSHLEIKKSQKDQEDNSSQTSFEDDIEEIQPQHKNKRLIKR